MTTIISDKLIKRCRRNEHTAQMELYAILFRSVYSASLRITGNTEDAQEIAQESFLKFFINIDQYYEKLPHIIRRIAINASIDMLRRRRVSFVELTPVHDRGEIDQADENLLEEQQQNVAAIKASIEQLPTGYRLVITLRLIEDLSFEDIASELGITSSTARSQFTRAKQKLIDILKTT